VDYGTENAKVREMPQYQRRHHRISGLESAILNYDGRLTSGNAGNVTSDSAWSKIWE